MSFEDLKDSLSGLLGNIESLGGGLADLGGKALQAATGFDASANRFRNAQGQFQKAGSVLEGVAAGGLTKVAGALNSAVGPINAVGGALMSIATGPVPSAKSAMASLGAVMGGAITAGADKAAEALGKLGPAGQAAGAAIQALGAIAAATVGQLMSLAGVAIEVVQKADLMRDRFAALAGTAAGGKAVQAMLANLNLPFSSSQVNEWGQSLLAAGVKGKQLEADVKAIAAATALMGDSGGAAAETLFKRLGEGGPAADKLLKTFQTGGPKADKLLKEMGLSLNDIGGHAALAKMTTEQLHEALAKAMQKKGDGPLKDLGLSLPVILQKAREGFLSLFGGLGGPVKAFMTAVKGLFGEFNKGSPIINALKPIVTSVFSTLFGWLTKGANAIHELIQGFMGVKGAKGPFAEIGASIRQIVDAFSVAKTAMSAVFKAISAGSGGGVSAMSVLAGIFKIVAMSIQVVTATTIAGMAVLGAIGDAVNGALGSLSGMASGAMEAASNFVQGLVDGISAGAGAVADAVKGLASGALSAFTGALGIKSPSTIMLEHGEENIAGAAAQGIEAGTPKVAQASAKMGESAEPGGGKGKAGAGGGGSGGGERHWHYHGPMSDYATFKAHVQRFEEEQNLEAGSAPEGA